MPARLQQRAGVVVPRRIEQRARGPLFNHATVLHHHDPVGNIGNHPQVMADKHQRAAVLLLKPF